MSAGARLINTVKFERYSSGDIVWTLQEHKQFPIFEEDLRSIIGCYETVLVRQSNRVTGAQPPERIEMIDTKREIVALEQLCMHSVNSEVKRRERPNL